MPGKDDERKRKEKEEKQKEIMRSQRGFFGELSEQQIEDFIDYILLIAYEGREEFKKLQKNESAKNKHLKRKYIEAILDHCFFYLDEITVTGPENIIIPSFVEYPGLQWSIAVALAIRNMLYTANILILFMKNPDNALLLEENLPLKNLINRLLEWFQECFNKIKIDFGLDIYRYISGENAALYIIPDAIRERLPHIDYYKNVRKQLLQLRPNDEVNIICDYLFESIIPALEEKDEEIEEHSSSDQSTALPADEEEKDDPVSVKKKDKPRELTSLQRDVLNLIPQIFPKHQSTEMKDGKPMGMAYQQIKREITQCADPKPSELKRIIVDVYNHVRDPRNEYNPNELPKFEEFMGTAVRAIVNEEPDPENENNLELGNPDDSFFQQPEDLDSPPPLNMVPPLDEEKSPRSPGFFQSSPDSPVSSNRSNVELQQTIDTLRERKDSAGTPQLERDLLERAINWGNRVLQGKSDRNSIVELRTTLQRVKNSTGTREEKARPLPESIETFLSSIESVNSAPRKKR